MTFGDDALVSWDCLFMDTDFHRILDADGIQVNADRDISIGNHVWVGCRSTILKGTTLLNGSVVAAGSITRSKIMKENVVIDSSGIKRDNIRWIHL